MNIEIANILYYMHQSVWKILEEYPEKIVDIIKKGADVSLSLSPFSSSMLIIFFAGLSSTHDENWKQTSRIHEKGHPCCADQDSQ